MSNILNYTLYVIFLLGIYEAGTLTYQDFFYGNICPKIVNMPACYIILVCFVLPFGAHLFKGNNSIYFIGTGLAWSIAAYGSIMQTMGVIECPKTSLGIPMCFVSFIIFTILISLKVFELHKTNS